jgi:putative membrane protein
VASRIDRFFSQADRDAIRAATEAAERDTAGELVVYVVERCDPYPEVAWKGALIGGAVGAAVAAMVVELVGGWGSPDYLWLLIGLQLGLLGGWLASRHNGIARRLIGQEAIESRAEGRAAEAFVDEQVFATQARTGILLFVALFEHQVLVLADVGIDERVAESAWHEITDLVASGMRGGAPALALTEAVGRCAAILEEHGVAGDRGDELSNAPRFRDE